jgi:hypothetical protein
MPRRPAFDPTNPYALPPLRKEERRRLIRLGTFFLVWIVLIAGMIVYSLLK